MSTTLRSRAEALLYGDTLYAPTEPCKNGSMAPRRVSSYACTCDMCSAQKREYARSYMRGYMREYRDDSTRLLPAEVRIEPSPALTPELQALREVLLADIAALLKVPVPPRQQRAPAVAPEDARALVRALCREGGAGICADGFITSYMVSALLARGVDAPLDHCGASELFAAAGFTRHPRRVRVAGVRQRLWYCSSATTDIPRLVERLSFTI